MIPWGWLIRLYFIHTYNQKVGLDHHFGHNVGANLVFALEQLFVNVFSSRANTRFAPTLGSPQRFHLAETMIKAENWWTHCFWHIQKKIVWICFLILLKIGFTKWTLKAQLKTVINSLTYCAMLTIITYKVYKKNNWNYFKKAGRLWLPKIF